VAGFVHIGTETRVPPERPRPDMDAITTWIANDPQRFPQGAGADHRRPVLGVLASASA
jgi:hypothetical protein